jgi:hypothetical protein
MAIFVSILPESIGSSTQMHQGGKSTRYVLLLWVAVEAQRHAGRLAALAAVLGFAVASGLTVAS